MSSAASNHGRRFASARAQQLIRAVYIAGGLVLTAIYFVFPSGSIGSHTTYEILGLITLAAVVTGVRRHHAHDRAWWLIALGLALWVGGDSYWNLHRLIAGSEAPFPSIADCMYLACYLPLLAGVFVFVRGGRPSLGDLLDGTIVGAGATLLIWFTVVGPVAHTKTPLLAHLVAAAYPVADNLLLLGLIQLVLARGLRHPASRYLLAAFGTVLATDVFYARARVSATFNPGGWLNVGYLLFYVLLGCAFLSPSIGRLTGRPREIGDTTSTVRLTTLMLPLLIVPLFVANGNARGVDAGILAGGGALISLLVFSRLVLVLKERDRLDDERLQANAELARMAYRDPLTGLANRSALYDAVEHSLRGAETSKRAIAVVFFDLDGFKAVNDLYGHAAGDRVLAEVARRLQSVVREQDVIARHGGDEFVAVLNGIPERNAASLAAKLVERVEGQFATPFQVDGHEHTLGISHGISLYPADGSSSEALISRADKAMYTHKEAQPPRLRPFLAT